MTRLSTTTTVLLVAAALSRAVEGRNPGTRLPHNSRPSFFLFGFKRSPYAHLPEFKAPRDELLEKITTLHSENDELKNQVTEYASTRSKCNTYLENIEKLLVQQIHAQRKRWLLGWITAFVRWIFGKQANHSQFLLEEIRTSSCTIQLLEEQVARLREETTTLNDQLLQRDSNIENLEVQLRSATQEMQKLELSLRNKKERKEHDRAIAKLQDQVDKARKEITRLTSQKNALAETKDKERLSFQLRIEQKQAKIDRLEGELDKKRQRVSDLEAEVNGIIARDRDYAEMQRENCRIKDERSQLQTRIANLEATVEGVKAETEQHFKVEVDKLANERRRLTDSNKELTSKVARLDYEIYIAKAKAARDQQTVEARVRKEVETSMNNQQHRLKERIRILESEQSHTMEENKSLNDALSSLQREYDVVAETQREHNRAELQVWKERAASLETQIAQANNSAKAATQESASLKQQLQEALESNRVLESRATAAESARSQKEEEEAGHGAEKFDSTINTEELERLRSHWKQTQDQTRAKLAELAKEGHEDCCQEALATNGNKEQMERLAQKLRATRNQDNARKRLEELSETTDSPPFVRNGFARPAFGLRGTKQGDV